MLTRVAWATGEARDWPVGFTREMQEAKAFHANIAIATLIGVVGMVSQFHLEFHLAPPQGALPNAARNGARYSTVRGASHVRDDENNVSPGHRGTVYGQGLAAGAGLAGERDDAGDFIGHADRVRLTGCTEGLKRAQSGIGSAHDVANQAQRGVCPLCGGGLHSSGDVMCDATGGVVPVVLVRKLRRKPVLHLF